MAEPVSRFPAGPPTPIQTPPLSPAVTSSSSPRPPAPPVTQTASMSRRVITAIDARTKAAGEALAESNTRTMAAGPKVLSTLAALTGNGRTHAKSFNAILIGKTDVPVLGHIHKGVDYAAAKVAHVVASVLNLFLSAYITTAVAAVIRGLGFVVSQVSQLVVAVVAAAVIAVGVTAAAVTAAAAALTFVTVKLLLKPVLAMAGGAVITLVSMVGGKKLASGFNKGYNAVADGLTNNRVSNAIKEALPGPVQTGIDNINAFSKALSRKAGIFGAGVTGFATMLVDVPLGIAGGIVANVLSLVFPHVVLSKSGRLSTIIGREKEYEKALIFNCLADRADETTRSRLNPKSLNGTQLKFARAERAKETTALERYVLSLTSVKAFVSLFQRSATAIERADRNPRMLNGNLADLLQLRRDRVSTKHMDDIEITFKETAMLDASRKAAAFGTSSRVAGPPSRRRGGSFDGFGEAAVRRSSAGSPRPRPPARLSPLTVMTDASPSPRGRTGSSDRT